MARRGPALRVELIAIFGTVVLSCIATFFAFQSSGSQAAPPPGTRRNGGEAIGPGLNKAQLYIEPSSGVRPVIRALDGAQHSIMVEDYILTDSRIVHALERATSLGVAVYVILEPHPLGMGVQPVVMEQTLRAAGCYVEWGHGFFLTHAKMLVIDDRLAIVSTANLSRTAFSHNREFLVFDRERAVVRQLSSVFRADWDHLKAATSDSNVVISPLNARRELTALIADSRHTLDIYAEEVADTAVGREVEKRNRAGLRVRILLPASAAHRAEALLGATRSVIRVMIRPYAHAKAVVVDDRIAFVGSENLSTASLDENREFGLLLRGSTVQRIERTFAQDWNRAKPAR